MGPESGGSAFVQGLSGALLVGLAGFLYLHTSYFQRFQHASAGQQTKASLSFAFGMGFLLLTSACMELLDSSSGINSLSEFWQKASPFPGLGTVFIVAPVTGLLVGVIGNFACLIREADRPFLSEKAHPLYTSNLRARMRLAALGRLAKITDDRLLATLWRAMTLGKLIQVTLKGRKVYIGSPLSSGDPSVESGWIKIIPIASGYRDSENLSYVPTTDYRALFDELAGNGGDEVIGLPASVDRLDLGILISWSDIVSLTIYDPALEEYFGFQVSDVIDEVMEV